MIRAARAFQRCYPRLVCHFKKTAKARVSLLRNEQVKTRLVDADEGLFGSAKALP